MRLPRWMLVPALALFAAGAGAAVFWLKGDDTAAARPSEATDRLQLLFELHAEEARVASTGGGYELELLNVSPNATAFTDRPRRSARFYPVPVLLAMWPRAFAGDPPNAALSSGAIASVLELSRPRASGASLVFDARPLTGVGATHLRKLVGKKLPQATVVLDDATTLPNNSVWAGTTGSTQSNTYCEWVITNNTDDTLNYDDDDIPSYSRWYDSAGPWGSYAPGQTRALLLRRTRSTGGDCYGNLVLSSAKYGTVTMRTYLGCIRPGAAGSCLLAGGGAGGGLDLEWSTNSASDGFSSYRWDVDLPPPPVVPSNGPGSPDYPTDTTDCSYWMGSWSCGSGAGDGTGPAPD
jgi:hypothetical protein